MTCAVGDVSGANCGGSTTGKRLANVGQNLGCLQPRRAVTPARVAYCQRDVDVGTQSVQEQMNPGVFDALVMDINTHLHDGVRQIVGCTTRTSGRRPHPFWLQGPCKRSRFACWCKYRAVATKDRVSLVSTRRSSQRCYR